MIRIVEGNYWIEQPEPRKRPGLFYVVRLNVTHGVVCATISNSADPKWAEQKALCELWRRLLLDAMRQGL